MRGLRLDPYILALLATVALASLFPVRGQAAEVLTFASKLVIAGLFFLHGTRLSRQAVIAGLGHWRLHLTVLAASFVLFPLLGLGAGLLPQSLLPQPMALGLIFLCCLPSTVQSSISFTAIARGNVAAAVCAASASNLLGMALTPLLVGVLMRTQGVGMTWSIAAAVLTQLLGPFVAGQVARPWVIGWIEPHARLVGLLDRGAILLVIYSAFSHAVADGVWTRVPAGALAVTAVLCALLLAVVLAATVRASRAMRFATEDEIAVVFCGSKKSIVTGAPMAAILFAPAVAGMMILPLMLYHQMQLIACSVIARRYAARVQETARAR